MVFSLAPNARRKSLFQISSTAVSTAEIIICRQKQLPIIFSAVLLSPLPMKIEALGAPPELINAAKAATTIIIGIQTPTPVKARGPSPGI